MAVSPKQPLVSYVIPVYNYGRYVATVLDSFLAQDYPNLEAIVVDDCSTDNSVEIIEQYAARDARIRLLKSDENRGVGASDATGVAAAKGELICIVDADDVLTPLKTTKQVAYMNAHRDVGVLATYTTQIDADGHEVPNGEQVRWSNQYVDLDDPQNWLWRNHIVRSSAMIRRSVFDKIGLPSAAHRAGQDYDLWLRALVGGFRIRALAEPLTLYRFHNAGISRRGNVERARFWGYAVTCYRYWHPHLEAIGRPDLVNLNLTHFASSPVYVEPGVAAKVWEILALPPSMPEAEAFARVRSDGLPAASLAANWAQHRIQSLMREMSSVQDELSNAYAAVDELREYVAKLEQQVEVDATELKETRTELSATQTAMRGALADEQKLRGSLTYRDGRAIGTPVRVGREYLHRAPRVHSVVHRLKERLLAPPKRLIKQAVSEGPLVSVVIPCFNYGHYIGKAVASVLARTFGDFELIVVDGGSTDGKTPQVVESLRQERVQVFLRSTPHLVGDNRNYGIARARGKYIVCLDADDLLDPTYLEKAVFLAEAGGFDIVHPAVQCFGNIQLLWENDDATLSGCVEGNQVSTVALFRRDLWRRNGGYVDFGLGEAHVPEDWEFWVRQLGNGARAKSIREPLMLYRTHDQGLTAHARMPVDKQRQKICAANKALLDDANVERLKKNRKYELVVDKPLLNLQKTFTAEREKRAMIGVPSPEQADAFALTLLAAKYLAQHDYRITFLCDHITDRRDELGVGAIRQLQAISFDIFDFAIAHTDGLRVNLAEYLWRSRLPELLIVDGTPGLAHRMQTSEALTPQTRIVADRTQLLDVVDGPGRSGKPSVLLCVPWLDRGGSSILLRSIFSKIVGDIDVHVLATNPEPCLHGTAPELYDYASSMMELDVGMPAERKRSLVVFAAQALGVSTIFVVGSRSAYQALDEIKRRRPSVRVVDQLYNPFGHLSANREVAHLIDHNIAASREVVAALVGKGAQTDEVTLVDHGVDLKLFNPAAISRRTRTTLSVGFLGRLSSEKRPLDVIEIAALLPHVRFRLAGSGPMAKEVAKHKADRTAQNCEVLGHVSSALRFYDTIDVLLLTSSIEGTPITMLEAMALGKIVVATRVGNIPNVIEHGVNGFLFNCGDIDELKTILADIASLTPQQRADIGRRARLSAERDHDVEAIARQYLALLFADAKTKPQTKERHTSESARS